MHIDSKLVFAKQILKVQKNDFRIVVICVVNALIHALTFKKRSISVR